MGISYASKLSGTTARRGNITFDNVLLYNILPSVDDRRGSTGSISCIGLENLEGATSTEMIIVTVKEKVSTGIDDNVDTSDYGGNVIWYYVMSILSLISMLALGERRS